MMFDVRCSIRILAWYILHFGEYFVLLESINFLTHDSSLRDEHHHMGVSKNSGTPKSSF